MGKFIITEEEKNRIRGLYEQSSNNGQKAFNTIKDAMAWPGTSEGNVVKGVKLIHSSEDYDYVLKKVKELNPKYTKIMDWISTDMSPTKKDLTGTLKTIVGANDDRNLDQIIDRLKQYNSNEDIRKK